MSNERYVVVTAVSQFRQRYVIPESELQGMSPDVKLDYPTMVSYANDEVTCESVKEFSQKWLGETILDSFIVDEERVLNLFDRDNDYLSSWTKEKKLEWIQDWEEKEMEFSTELLKNRPIDFPTDYVEQSNLTSQKMNEDFDNNDLT